MCSKGFSLSVRFCSITTQTPLLEALPIYQQALEENHPRTQNLRSWLDAVQSGHPIATEKFSH